MKVLLTEEEQFDKFFYQGHPLFFVKGKVQEIIESYGDFYDFDGAEVTKHKVLDNSTGLTFCEYEIYNLQEKEESEPLNLMWHIEGIIKFSEEVRDYVFYVEKYKIYKKVYS